MDKNDNKEFWDRFAKFYGFFMRKIDKTYAEMNVLIKKQLHSNMDVLELACGTGQLSYPLADSVNRYIATDFSSEMVDHARNDKRFMEGGSLEFAVQDATSLDYCDNSFDVVIISNAMHVVPDPETVLSEVKRVLKPNGIFIAPTFVWGNKLGNRINLWFLKKIGFKIFHQWSEKEYISFLENKGFKLKESALLGTTLSPLCYVALVNEK